MYVNWCVNFNNQHIIMQWDRFLLRLSARFIGGKCTFPLITWNYRKFNQSSESKFVERKKQTNSTTNFFQQKADQSDVQLSEFNATNKLTHASESESIRWEAEWFKRDREHEHEQVRLQMILCDITINAPKWYLIRDYNILLQRLLTIFPLCYVL